MEKSQQAFTSIGYRIILHFRCIDGWMRMHKYRLCLRDMRLLYSIHIHLYDNCTLVSVGATKAQHPKHHHRNEKQKDWDETAQPWETLLHSILLHTPFKWHSFTHKSRKKQTNRQQSQTGMRERSKKKIYII